MIAIFDSIPQNCPACGTLLHIDNDDPSKITRFEAFQADACPECGSRYQLATQKDILRAATASGGNLVDLMVQHPDDGE